MPLNSARALSALLVVLASLAVARPARAVGESTNGFPNWAERVVHEWMNRARSDPSIEMAACGARCGDATCYGPIAPLLYSEALNRSARFHSDEMVKQNYVQIAHDSECGLVANINALYPATCDGAASCACTGGTKTCPCTSWSQRIQLFGAQPSGEIIASGNDPDGAFYQWLFENFAGPMAPPNCAYVQGPPTNGHRWNILKSAGTVGVGVAVSGAAVGDFSGGAGTPYKIPSGSHYPRQAASVDAWASWADTAAPRAALINVDGTCSAMTRKRGSDTNGAWSATVTGVGSGCHRYFFNFKDSAGNVVTYPTTGSLGIGPEGTCADWDSTRPPTGAGCDCVAQCSGKTCGVDGCGGSCGNCASTATCNAGGQCVPNAGGDAGSRADAAGPGADGGTPTDDSGAITTRPDASAGGDSGANAQPGASDSTGCTCDAPGTGRAGSTAGVALGLALATLARARRRVRASSAS